MIQTARLRLLPCAPAHFAALLRHDLAELAGLLNVRPEPDWLRHDEVWAILPQAECFLREHPEAATWWLYFFVHRTQKALLGVGGFKGAPSAEGAVEIGYSIAPAFRQQGYATEAVQGMLAHAFSQPAVRQVLAHTLPQPNWSTHILQKAGFVFQQEVADPTDGPAWLWALPRTAYQSP